MICLENQWDGQEGHHNDRGNKLETKKVQQTIWSNNFWILKGFSNTVAATRDFQDKHRLTFLALSQILVTFQAIFTQSKYPVLEGLIIVLKNH